MERVAKLKIYAFPDQVLAKKALPIQRVEKSLYSFADSMLETMYDAPGVGLAANQVGVLQQILVVDTDYDLEDPAEAGEAMAGVEVVGRSRIRNKAPRIIINPEIIYREGSVVQSEACLSVPEFSAEVKRFEKIKLKFQDIDGVTQTLSAEGLLAICIQHEMDHLEGKLFIDRLSPLKKEMVRKKLRQERLEKESQELLRLDSKTLQKKKSPQPSE
jgi:peptide deformylase